MNLTFILFKFVNYRYLRRIIRSTKKEDADFCLDICLDDEMGKYLSDPPREKAAGTYIKWKDTVEVYDGCYYFIAVSNENKNYIGTCSAVPSEDKTHWDLGYAIHKKYWCKGYATEMINALCDFCIENGAEYITADVAKLNNGSNAVLKNLVSKLKKRVLSKKVELILFMKIILIDLIYNK